MSNPRPLRKLGAVSYLNTVPLIHCFDEVRRQYSLHLDYPSRLADQLSRGDLDAALIPSFEVFGNAQYQIVSDACIGCRGEVWSVKLLTRVPLPSVRLIALDEGSRTSVALTRILCRKHWGIEPEFKLLPLDEDYHRTSADAVLVIGDRAMNPSSDFLEHYDLGQVWRDWMKLPFVFAVWAARPDADLSFLDRELALARDQGLHRIPEIVEQCHRKYGLTREQCQKYLGQHLNYYLGDEERESLRRFANLAYELKLISEQPTLNFYDYQIA